MLKRILVGLNGSEYSVAAMDLAIALAKRHGAALVGLGIVDAPHLIAPESVPLGAGAFKERRDTAVLQDADSLIDQVLVTFDEHCAAMGLNGCPEKRIGSPAEILARQSQGYDLLVVGKRHLPQDEWEQSGHILDQLLRHSPRPVLCVPAARVNGSPVLVAYDGSTAAARTLQAFVESGLGADREIHLAALGNQAQESAELARDFLTAHAMPPRLLIEGSAAQPALQLLKIAQQIQAGLIVMGACGQPRLKEFFLGSVSQGVLAATTVPLFLYH